MHADVEVLVFTRDAAKVRTWSQILQCDHLAVAVPDGDGQQVVRTASSFTVTSNPEQAARRCDMLILSLPAFLHAKYLALLAPHLEDGCVIVGLPGGLRASHHADLVLSTDRNPRALAFTAFTMALNSIANVTTRQGDLFEPVAGEQFGLIVANPPFVVSPVARFTWRDGGLPLDGLCQRIAERAPAHLVDGGWCQFMANWAHLAHGDWKERLASWFAGSGCDVWGHPVWDASCSRSV